MLARNSSQVLFWRLLIRWSFVWVLDVLFFVVVYFGLLPNTGRLASGDTIDRELSGGKEVEFRLDPQGKSYVRLNEVSRYLRASVLALEDAKFYEHRGFDVEEMIKALEATLQKGRRLRGASTISQQLVKNLYLTHERSFRRKFLEALITIKMENTLSKNKILEIYLNSIEWGRGLMGIKDASYYYFKKRPRDLSVKEAVFLAAIIPNPARFGRLDDNQTPRRFVRKQMGKALQSLYYQGLISLDDFRDALFRPLELNP